jgi:hypothetical protein
MEELRSSETSEQNKHTVWRKNYKDDHDLKKNPPPKPENLLQEK